MYRPSGRRGWAAHSGSPYKPTTQQNFFRFFIFSRVSAPVLTGHSLNPGSVPAMPNPKTPFPSWHGIRLSLSFHKTGGGSAMPNPKAPFPSWHGVRLSLSFHKIGGGSAMTSLKTPFSSCHCSRLSLSLYNLNGTGRTNLLLYFLLTFKTTGHEHETPFGNYGLRRHPPARQHHGTNCRFQHHSDAAANGNTRRSSFHARCPHTHLLSQAQRRAQA